MVSSLFIFHLLDLPVRVFDKVDVESGVSQGAGNSLDFLGKQAPCHRLAFLSPDAILQPIFMDSYVALPCLRRCERVYMCGCVDWVCVWLVALQASSSSSPSPSIWEPASCSSAWAPSSWPLNAFATGSPTCPRPKMLAHVGLVLRVGQHREVAI